MASNLRNKPCYCLLNRNRIDALHSRTNVFRVFERVRERIRKLRTERERENRRVYENRVS